MKRRREAFVRQSPQVGADLNGKSEKAEKVPKGSMRHRLLKRISGILRWLFPKQKGSVCIGGYAGCKNLGDDAILEGYLLHIRQNSVVSAEFSSLQNREDLQENRFSAPPNAEKITVFSGSPRRDSKRFGVRCVNRHNLFSVLFTLARSEVFLCGGGSLLQNTTGNASLLFYLFWLRAALLLGCRTSLLAGGIGPIEGEGAIRLTVSVLNRCHTVELRDADSYRLLISLGVKPELLRTVQDPALYLPIPPPERRAYLLWENGLDPKTAYFCAILRPVSNGGFGVCEGLGAALRILRAKRNALPLFMIFDSEQDTEISYRVAKKCGGKVIRIREASDALALLSGAKLAFCMRLHGLILSHAAKTHAIGVTGDGKDTKLASFCRAFGFPFACMEEESIVSLVTKIDEEA